MANTRTLVTFIIVGIKKIGVEKAEQSSHCGRSQNTIRGSRCTFIKHRPTCSSNITSVESEQPTNTHLNPVTIPSPQSEGGLCVAENPVIRVFGYKCHADCAGRGGCGYGLGEAEGDSREVGHDVGRVEGRKRFDLIEIEEGFRAEFFNALHNPKSSGKGPLKQGYSHFAFSRWKALPARVGGSARASCEGR